MSLAQQKPRAPKRCHITTTLPLDLADQLDDYVRAEKVNKNQVIENSIRAFLLKEMQRKK